MMTLDEAKAKLAKLEDEYKKQARALRAYIKVLESQEE